MSLRLAIDGLGAQGDGLASLAGARLFVPFTLPGEVVEAVRSGDRADVTALLERSPHRQAAPCPHFGLCGGCDLQHADDALYGAFKRDLVVEALRQRGLDAPVAALVPCPPRSRRRAVFSADMREGAVAFGFHQARSHTVAPIAVCLVAVPAIADRLDALRALARLACDRRRTLRMTVTATGDGLDVALADAAPLDEARRRQVAAFALREDFARLSLDGERIVEARPPRIDVEGVAVPLPPGAFLQAVAAAEAAMAAVAVPHLAGCRRTADLFSGIGTFALRLARHGAVHAVEADAAALASLALATRTPSGLKALTQERRDLFRRPVTAKELARFDGVLFDPPRAGAEAQAREIAASRVHRVSAVSCNPATLARDLRILVDGGFRLLDVTPVDQFLWSHHVEAVARLAR